MPSPVADKLDNNHNYCNAEDGDNHVDEEGGELREKRRLRFRDEDKPNHQEDEYDDDRRPLIHGYPS